MPKNGSRVCSARGEDALPAARCGRRDREPKPGRSQRALGADAERALDALREPQRPDRRGQPLGALDLHRDGRARRPEPGHPARGGRTLGRAAGRVHRGRGDGPDRRLHRERPRVPRSRAPLHRGRQREHRRHAAAAPLLARGRRGDRARADGHLHAEPEGEGLPGRPPDRRRPRAGRDAGLQLGLLRGVEEGRAADVEQARLRPRRDPAPRGMQDHSDRARQPGRADRRPLRHGQDDDHLHAPERLVAGAGRLRRVDAERAGLRDRERLLRPTHTWRTSRSTATRSISTTRTTPRTGARPSRSA